MNDLAPDAIIQAQAAFLKDLGELLKRCRGQWVAYGPSGRVMVGKSQEAVYQCCLNQGLSEEEFLVLCVEPDAGTATVYRHLHWPEGP